jgi:hypothetical protein
MDTNISEEHAASILWVGVCVKAMKRAVFPFAVTVWQDWVLSLVDTELPVFSQPP